MTPSKGFYYSVLAAFFWSVYLVLLRLILAGGESVYNVMLLVPVIGLPFWAFLIFKKKHELAFLKRKDFVILAGMALVGMAGGSIAEIYALKYGQAANYSFLIRTVTLFTFVFAAIFLKEKLTAVKIFIGALIIAGAYLLTSPGQSIALSAGDFFTVLTAIFFAFGNNVLGKLSTNKISAELSASITMILGFIPMVAISLFYKPKPDLTGIVPIAVLAIVYILITISRFNAYKNASASYVSVMFSLSPVFVVAMSFLFLKESMTITQIAGGLIIVACSLALQKRKF